MLPLENKKKIVLSNIPSDIFASNKTIPINDNRNKNILDLSFNTSSLSKKFKQDKLKRNLDNLSDPTLMEMELTPRAKKYIKTILFPFAVFSYILQKSSVAFGKVIAATISFLVFSFINCISSASIGAYEVKLPIISVCLMGGILGARDLIRSIKKIILSVPEGTRTCYQNISCNDCSIFDFICGIDKHKKNIIKKLSKKLF